MLIHKPQMLKFGPREPDGTDEDPPWSGGLGWRDGTRETKVKSKGRGAGQACA